MYRFRFRTIQLLILMLMLPLAHAKKPREDAAEYDRHEIRQESSHPERPLRGRVYNPDHRDQGRNDAPGKSLSQAIDEARQRSGGRVLSAEPYRDRRGAHYRVKVLTPNGRIQTLYINAD